MCVCYTVVDIGTRTHILKNSVYALLLNTGHLLVGLFQGTFSVVHVFSTMYVLIVKSEDTLS